MIVTSNNRVSVNLILLVVMSILISSCSIESSYNFKIREYQRVDKGYQYSNDMLNYQGENYRPILTSEYFCDTLSSILIYKSEGKISYSKSDLDTDSI